MNILIIGSQGFIGRHLVKHFLHKNSRVTGCDLVENVTPGYTYHKVSVLSPDFETLFSNQILMYALMPRAAGMFPIRWNIRSVILRPILSWFPKF